MLLTVLLKLHFLTIYIWPFPSSVFVSSSVSIAQFCLPSYPAPDEYIDLSESQPNENMYQNIA